MTTPITTTTKPYEMTEGIEIVNTLTGEVGVALEYTFLTVYAYRFDKTPDSVQVRLPSGEERVWMLKNAMPKNTTPKEQNAN